MGMQRTPLLMHKLVERGAVVAPDEQVVTATATGVRRQTYKQTRDRAHQLATNPRRCTGCPPLRALHCETPR